MATPQEILRKIRRIELRTRRLVNTSFAGQYHSVFKGQGMNFEEVREYSPGDEIRSIDWNVTARMNVPHVKTFTEERELTVMIVLDVSGSGVFGSVDLSKREMAVEVAAVLAFSAIHNNDKVGLLLFSDRIELFMPPKKGRQHALRLIREMLYFDPQGRGTDLASALQYLNRVLVRRSVVFLISDFLAPDFSRQLTPAARRHDVVAMPIIDPGEEHLPDVGLIALEDAETGELVEIDTGSRSVRAKFAEAALQRRKAMDKLFAARRIDSVPLATDADAILALRSFFENRERRRAA
ncbi:MAG: DUF58 domain-containing protein [Terrimicrobiaceae bacterium]